VVSPVVHEDGHLKVHHQVGNCLATVCQVLLALQHCVKGLKALGDQCLSLEDGMVGERFSLPQPHLFLEQKKRAEMRT
jgi:hypothetical protein